MNMEQARKLQTTILKAVEYLGERLDKIEAESGGLTETEIAESIDVEFEPLTELLLRIDMVPGSERPEDPPAQPGGEAEMPTEAAEKEPAPAALGESAPDGP